jgi:hypothetical protein
MPNPKFDPILSIRSLRWLGREEVDRLHRIDATSLSFLLPFRGVIVATTIPIGHS